MTYGMRASVARGTACRLDNAATFYMSPFQFHRLSRRFDGCDLRKNRPVKQKAQVIAVVSVVVAVSAVHCTEFGSTIVSMESGLFLLGRSPERTIIRETN